MKPDRFLKILLTSILIGLVPACGGETDPDEQTAEKKDTRPAILFLGDSLTAGRGLAQSESAPALIQKKFNEKNMNFRVINAGKSGDTTRGGLSRIDWYLSEDQNIHSVVIGLGSNDAMRGVEIAEIKKNIIDIVDKIREHNSTIRIFLYQMYTFPNMGKDYAGNYEKVFSQVARERNIILLPFPLEGVAGNPELNQDDGIHPTAEGTVIMAENIARSLIPELKTTQ